MRWRRQHQRRRVASWEVQKVRLPAMRGHCLISSRGIATGYRLELRARARLAISRPQGDWGWLAEGRDEEASERNRGMSFNEATDDRLISTQRQIKRHLLEPVEVAMTRPKPDLWDEVATTYGKVLDDAEKSYLDKAHRGSSLCRNLSLSY